MKKDIIIFGLGNPGKEYEKTKHNIGRYILQLYGERIQQSFSKNNTVLELKVCHENTVLHFCITNTHYMNESGIALKEFFSYNNLQAAPVLVIQDDTDQPSLHVKLVRGGGSGGHKGIISIQQVLLSCDPLQIYRLKLGVRNENETRKSGDFVLTKMDKNDFVLADRVVELFTNTIFVQLLIEGDENKLITYTNTYFS